MIEPNARYDAWAYLQLVLLALVWGSSFILMKIGLFGWAPGPGDPPILNGVQLGFLRIMLAGLALFPLALRHVRGISSLTWGALAVNGFVGSLIPAMLFAWAQMRLPSAVAGMLNALSPLWTLLFAVGFYGTTVARKQVFGLLLGFVGASGLMLLKDAKGTVHWEPAAMLMVATACYGLSINVVRNRLMHVPAVGISALALSMTALPAGLGFLLTGGWGALSNGPEAGESLLAVAVLAWMGTAGALILFNALIKRTSALFASSVTYVIPLVALFWGWLDGEWIGWPHILLGAVVLSGVRMVTRA